MHQPGLGRGLVVGVAVAFTLSCQGSDSSSTSTGVESSGGAGGTPAAEGSSSETTSSASPIGTSGTPDASNSPGPSGGEGATGATGATGNSGNGGTGATVSVDGSAGMDSTEGAGGEAIVPSATPTGDGTGGGASGSGPGGAPAGGGGGAGTSTAGMSAAAGDGSGGSSSDGVTPSAGCGMTTSLTSGRASIDVNGKMREYILQIPDDYDPDQPYRLVFGWHPWGGSAQQIAQQGYFGLESVVDGQAILVAPEGQDYQDNGLGWGNEGGEDVDFMHAMLDRFESELCIDEERVFSTGFSFGAMFSFNLACNQDGRMRAIAPEAGNATTSGRCEDGTRRVATLAFIGTDDTLLSGHRQAVDIFVERNGCSSETVELQTSWCDGLADNFLPCTCVEYQGCDDGYPVIACEYNAGHQFAPSAGQTLWDFFSQF